jgi:hypothetical protein
VGEPLQRRGKAKRAHAAPTQHQSNDMRRWHSGHNGSSSGPTGSVMSVKSVIFLFSFTRVFLVFLGVKEDHRVL